MSCILSSTLSEDVLVRSPEVARAEAARVKRTRREWNPAIISCYTKRTIVLLHSYSSTGKVKSFPHTSSAEEDMRVECGAETKGRRRRNGPPLLWKGS